MNAEGKSDAFGLSTFEHLVVAPADAPNVWDVRLPALPWRINKALSERMSLVSRMEAAFPFQAIWMSDWTSDEYRGWRILDRTEGFTTLDSDELKSGAWALFFFRDAPPGEKLLTVVPREPDSAAAAVQMLEQTASNAAIWSWYDDLEWLVAGSTKI